MTPLAAAITCYMWSRVLVTRLWQDLVWVTKLPNKPKLDRGDGALLDLTHVH